MKLFQTLTGAVGADEKGLQGDTGLAVADAAATDEDVSSRRLMASPRSSRRVADVAATGLPVWVGRGAGDDAWPHAVQDDMAARLGTTVHVVAGADHSPAVENPVGLAAAWLSFLEETS